MHAHSSRLALSAVSGWPRHQGGRARRRGSVRRRGLRRDRLRRRADGRPERPLRGGPRLSRALPAGRGGVQEAQQAHLLLPEPHPGKRASWAKSNCKETITDPAALKECKLAAKSQGRRQASRQVRAASGAHGLYPMEQHVSEHLRRTVSRALVLAAALLLAGSARAGAFTTPFTFPCADDFLARDHPDPGRLRRRRRPAALHQALQDARSRTARPGRRTRSSARGSSSRTRRPTRTRTARCSTRRASS